MSERTAARMRLLAVVLGVSAWIVAAAYLWRTSVPSLRLGGFDADRLFSPRLLARARSYDGGVRALWAGGVAAELVTLGVLAWRLPRSARGIGLGRVGSAIVIGMVVVAALWAVSLPFSVAGLWWQHHYGLGPFDPGSWVASQRATLAGSAVAALAAIAAVVALAVRFPRGWWLPAAAAVAALAALLALASGWLAADGTHPIRQAWLRADVRRLEAVEGVRPPVRVEKVSGFTREPNAFTSGFGPSTHVVLWNTLLDGRFSHAEVAVVVAHELGHAARGHIPKGVGWTALFALPAALVVAAATRRRGGLRNPANVPLAILVLTVLGLAALPLENAISRRYEAEADWRALLATRDPAAMSALFRKFVPATLAEPDPPLWDYAFLETHPTIAQRLAMAHAYAVRTGRAARASRAGP